MSRVATKGLHQIFRKSILSQSTRAASVRTLTFRKQSSSVTNERKNRFFISYNNPIYKMSTVQTTFTPDFLFRQVSLSHHSFFHLLTYKYFKNLHRISNQLISMVELNFHWQPVIAAFWPRFLYLHLSPGGYRHKRSHFDWSRDWFGWKRCRNYQRPWTEITLFQ